jgi:hypothetical protein
MDRTLWPFDTSKKIFPLNSFFTPNGKWSHKGKGQMVRQAATKLLWLGILALAFVHSLPFLFVGH